MALFLASAVIYRLAARRPAGDSMAGGMLAVALALAAVVLQFIEYIVLDFGASEGGYAAVFFGWTATYAIVAVMGLYWIEIQVASLWRVRREGRMRETEGPTSETALLLAGIEASSFYWAFFVAIGVVAYILLYLVADHVADGLVAGPVAAIRRAGRDAVCARQPRAGSARSPCRRWRSSRAC